MSINQNVCVVCGKPGGYHFASGNVVCPLHYPMMSYSASQDPNRPGQCKPATPLTEEDVRLIVREEILKQHQTDLHGYGLNQPSKNKCAGCGKKLYGLSIPRLGIYEDGDFCRCVKG